MQFSVISRTYFLSELYPLLRIHISDRVVKVSYEKWTGGIEAYVLDCDIVVSGFDLHARYYVHCQNYILEEGMKLIIPQCPYCSSTRMALALDNPRRLIRDVIKQRYQIQTKKGVSFFSIPGKYYFFIPPPKRHSDVDEAGSRHVFMCRVSWRLVFECGLQHHSCLNS